MQITINLDPEYETSPELHKLATFLTDLADTIARRVPPSAPVHRVYDDAFAPLPTIIDPPHDDVPNMFDPAAVFGKAPSPVVTAGLLVREVLKDAAASAAQQYQPNTDVERGGQGNAGNAPAVVAALADAINGLPLPTDKPKRKRRTKAELAAAQRAVVADAPPGTGAALVTPVTSEQAVAALIPPPPAIPPPPSAVAALDHKAEFRAFMAKVVAAQKAGKLDQAGVAKICGAVGADNLATLSTMPAAITAASGMVDDAVMV